MASFLRGIRDLALLIVRIAFGVLMVANGWHRWQGEGVQSQINFLHMFTVPYANYVAWTLIILELVGGIFLIVGAITPIVALLFVVEQGLTIAYTSFYHPGPITLDGGIVVQGFEYNGALAAIALLLLVFGAGRISVDQLFRRSKPEDDSLEDVDV